MTDSIKKISIMGLFTALGVALGYMLATIPNIELVTATIFISGCLLGSKEGFIIGLITEAIYSILNPFGPAPFPIFIAQVLSMGIAGMCGGMIFKKTNHFSMFTVLIFGLMGFTITILFDFSTTLLYSLFAGYTGQKLMASIASGIVFYTLHIVSNTLIFLFLIPIILTAIRKKPHQLLRVKES